MFGFRGWVFVGCGMGGFIVVGDGCDCVAMVRVAGGSGSGCGFEFVI